MDIRHLDIPGLLLLHAHVHRDHRGSFHESWNEQRFRDAGLPVRWVQDNVAVSARGVLRGLHFQEPRPQAKLVSVLHGEVFDVAVDLRPDSPTRGRYAGVTLRAGDGQALLIPEGCAHGYVALSDGALVAYKCSDFYVPACDRAIRWDDPELAIDWPVERPILSDKDANAMSYRQWRELVSTAV